MALLLTLSPEGAATATIRILPAAGSGAVPRGADVLALHSFQHDAGQCECVYPVSAGNRAVSGVPRSKPVLRVAPCWRAGRAGRARSSKQPLLLGTHGSPRISCRIEHRAGHGIQADSGLVRPLFLMELAALGDAGRRSGRSGDFPAFSRQRCCSASIRIGNCCKRSPRTMRKTGRN